MKFSHVQNIDGFAIVGATGMVGQEMLSILEEYKVRIPRVKLLASRDSVGETVTYFDEELTVEELKADSFDDMEVAFFSVPNDITKKYAVLAASAGCLVVDDSSTFRMNPEVPLIVPQINGPLLRAFEGKMMATPNCSTTPLAMACKPLLDRYGIERIVVSTYQAVSGAGRDAYQELSDQAIGLLSGTEKEPVVFPHRIAFNCLPLIGSVTENGNSEEEEKVGRELRKILEAPEIRVSTTAVRVPTFCGHGLSVNVELKQKFDRIEEVRELFDAFPGLKVLDKPEANIYPTNAECIGSDYTFVGRVRRDSSVPSGVNFWVITDNLRKGAAFNALESLETLYKYRKMS